MIDINDLKPEEHYIAFEWKYGVSAPDGEIVVAQITAVYPERILVHFLYGYKSEAEFVEKPKILAIGNQSGTHRLKGWGGNFDILQPEHPLIIADQYIES